MNILGLNSSPHDRSAAIVSDGQVIAAIEEERITREKRSMSYDISKYTIHEDGPYFNENFKFMSSSDIERNLQLSIDYCLEKAKLKEKDIDLIVTCNILPNTPFRDKSIFINHHLAHAAHTYFMSGFQDAMIIVADGSGSFTDGKFETLSLYKAEGNQISLLHKINGVIADYEGKQMDTLITLTNSLGSLYRNTSALLGYGNFGEGKIMGLAPYGKPLFIKEIFKYIDIDAENLSIDNKGIYVYLRDLLGDVDDASFEMKANVAASVQHAFDSVMVNFAKYAYELGGSDNLCLAGGCFLNAITNTHLSTKTEFKNIYIPSAPGDSGISLGAALLGSKLYDNKKNQKQNNGDVYFGKTYTDSEILAAIKKHKGKIRRVDSKDIFKSTSKLLHEGKVIGWFQGGSEFGPRALGNRSILANPRAEGIRDHINSNIKHREWFRPLAPALLRDRAELHFDLGKLEDVSLMLFILECKDKPEELQEALHIDGTARLQTVSEEDNDLFYKLLKEFYNLTGIPGLLNTSFNLNNQPIVETPEDAIETFLNAPLDNLVLGNYLLSK